MSPRTSSLSYAVVTEYAHCQLRNMWLSIVDASSSDKQDVTTSAQFSLLDPLSHSPSHHETKEAPSPVLISRAVSLLPNPFVSFISSKASVQTLRSPGALRRRHTFNAPHSESTQAMQGVRIDILHWLNRATLDVIGDAGFGYRFNSLSATAGSSEGETELAHAFSVIFSAARQFRIISVLQAWFPVLRKIVRGSSYDLVEKCEAEILPRQADSCSAQEQYSHERSAC